MGSLCLSAQIDSEQSLETSLTEVLDDASNFKEYKVIKRTELSKLKKDLKSYAQELNNEISTLNDTITAQGQTIADLRNEIAATNKDLDTVNAEKDSMQFLGLQTTKAVYNIALWGFVALLAALLAFFILKYRTSNNSTRSSLNQLKTTEQELEELRRRSIEKEQKLGRQLQDERNKLAKLKSE